MKLKPRVRREMHCRVCDQNFADKAKFFEHASLTHCSTSSNSNSSSSGNDSGGDRDTVHCFLVKLESTEDYYTMFVEMASHATLFELDALLREEWVECCWHISRFTITRNSSADNTTSTTTTTVSQKQQQKKKKRRLSAVRKEQRVLAMDTRIGHQLLPLGPSLKYEYDSGTPTIVYAMPVLEYHRARQSTDRTLTAQQQQQQQLGELDCTDTVETEQDFERYTAGGNNVGEVPQDVKVIGRNVPPTYWCEQCDSREAKYLDQECEYMTLCVQCAASDRHSDHDGMIVLGNSPRDGLCGYGEAVGMDDVLDDAEEAMA